MKFDSEIKKVFDTIWETKIHQRTAVLRMSEDLDFTVFLWKFEDEEE